MQASRGLLALVIVMGALIVLGTTGLVVVVMHRILHPAASLAILPAPVPAPAPMPAGREGLGEPPGTRIVSVSRQSDTVLAIALAGGGPDRVLIWDYRQARRLTELALDPATR